jgi:hypothetical protein
MKKRNITPAQWAKALGLPNKADVRKLLQVELKVDAVPIWLNLVPLFRIPPDVKASGKKAVKRGNRGGNRGQPRMAVP